MHAKPPLYVSLLLSCALAASSARAQMEDAKHAAVVRADADAHTFSLQTALTAMRAGHPALKNAEYAVRAARADQVTAKLWTNPQLGGGYTAGVRRASYDNAGYINYGITQFLELSNAPGARKRSAGFRIDAAQADYQSLVVQLSLDVEAAMIDVAAAQRKVRLVERALGLLETAASIVQKRVQAGASPRYDQARIGVTTANAHADLDVAKADLARAWAELRAAVGPNYGQLQGEADYELEKALTIPAPPQLVEALIQRRPDVQAALKRAESAQVDITVARRTVWPGLALSAQGGFGQGPGQVDVGVGVIVPIPLVDRGQGAIAAAEERSRQALAYRDSLLVPAKARIEGMHLEVSARNLAYDDYLSRTDSSGDEMLSEAQAGYLAGRFSVLELADAYVSWRDLRLRAIDLAASARQAEIDLGREVGSPLRSL